MARFAGEDPRGDNPYFVRRCNYYTPPHESRTTRKLETGRLMACARYDDKAFVPSEHMEVPPWASLFPKMWAVVMTKLKLRCLWFSTSLTNLAMWIISFSAFEMLLLLRVWLNLERIPYWQLRTLPVGALVLGRTIGFR